MRILFYILAGAAGGVLAGMGMGGGTLTIPILVLFLGVEQLTAQYANLLAFLPGGAAALIVHAKNGLLRFDDMGYVLLPALIGCALSAYFAAGASALLLKRLFGGFMTAVALASLFTKTLKKS